MTIKELMISWIENCDTTPEEIDLDEATEYMGYIDPETMNEIEETVTPELIRDIWNELL